MGFDAGSLTAHLKLDRSEFQQGLDEAKQEGRDFEAQEITVPVTADTEQFTKDIDDAEAQKTTLEEPADVPVTADTTEFDKAVADVTAAKDDLSTVPADVPVGMDKAEFDAGVAEVEVAKEDLSAAPATIKVEVDDAPAVAEALVTREAVKEALGEDPVITPEVDAGPAIAEAASYGALIDTMLGQGVSKSELPSALSSLGFNKSDITSMMAPLSNAGTVLGSGNMAQDIASMIPPTSPLIQRLDSGGSGGASTWASQATGVLRDIPNTNGASLAQSMSAAGATPAEIAAHMGTDVSSIESLLGMSGGSGGGLSAAESFAKKWRADTASALTDIQSTFGDKLSGQNPWLSLFKGRKGIEADLSKWAKKAGVTVGEDFSKAMSKGTVDAAKAATGGGIFGSALQSVVGGAGSGLQAMQGLSPAVQGAIVAAPIVVPILGAVGAAAGGALAGTAIGGAGFLAAMVPGLLDLMHGYSAYSALSTGASTKGMASGSIAIGKALQPIIGQGKGLLGGLENSINPQIVKFLNALAGALPSIGEFGAVAVNSMSGFFGAIDKGLASGGFKSFMKTMTQDVGPIMSDFGKVFINIGNAFGGFLKLFGGKPAQMVGSWFVSVTGDLAKFLNHVQLGNGFLSGMVTAFGFLGGVLSLVSAILGAVFKALAPIGLNLMKVLTPALAGLTDIIHLFPTDLLTGIAAGLLALTVATSPVLAVAAAILALGYAINFLGHQHIKSPAMTAKQIEGAAAAAKAQAEGKHLTPAQIAALHVAQVHGVTPAHLIPAAALLTPQPNNTSPADTGVYGNSPADQRLKKQQQTLAKLQSPVMKTGFWESFQHQLNYYVIDPLANAVEKIIAFIPTWTKFWNQMGADLNGYYIHVQNAIDHIINFFAQLGDAIAQYAGDVGHWAALAWGFFDRDFVQKIANFATKTIPHTFDNIIGWFKALPGRIVKAIGSGLTLLSGWGNDIANGITNGITNGLGGIGNAFKGIANDIIKAVDSAINLVNSKTKGIPLIGSYLQIPDIPTIGGGGGGGAPAHGNGVTTKGLPAFADGGWVGGPPGAPQLAIVHGGEFVQSRSMLASGTGGGQGPLQIYVDARGATDPAGVQAAAIGGINAAIPALTEALRRGAA